MGALTGVQSGEAAAGSQERSRSGAPAAATGRRPGALPFNRVPWIGYYTNAVCAYPQGSSYPELWVLHEGSVAPLSHFFLPGYWVSCELTCVLLRVQYRQ